MTFQQDANDTYVNGQPVAKSDVRALWAAVDSVVANSGKVFTNRAAAVSAGQTNLPGTLGLIFTIEGENNETLAVRSFSNASDDPLFATAPRWGVAMRVPNVLALDGKASLPNTAKSFGNRTGAVSYGQENLPATLGRIFTREGNYLVLRSAGQTEDDPLFEEAPRWGVLDRFPAASLLDAKAELAYSGRIFPTRAQAVSAGQEGLPGAVSRILTHEGDYLVLRGAPQTEDALFPEGDFPTGPRWGIVDRYPAETILLAETAAREEAIQSEALKSYRSRLGFFVGVIAAGASLIPSVVSADNRVLLGNDALSSQAYYRASLGNYVGTLPVGATVVPATVGSDDRVLIGSDTAGGAPGSDIWRIWANTGQSNGLGATDVPASLVYPSTSVSLLTLARGGAFDQWTGLEVGGSSPSIELNAESITAIAPMAVQFSTLGHGTTAAEAAARAAITRGRGPIIVWSNAEGARSIDRLLPDPPSPDDHSFSNFVKMLTRAQAMKPENVRLVYEWAFNQQGENNTATADLGELHDQLRQAYQDEAQTILGQHEALRMISWQASSFGPASEGVGVRSILQFALDHAVEGTFFCGGPTYCFPWYGDDDTGAGFLHQYSLGHAMRGEMGEAIARRVETDGYFEPLHMVSAAVTGANEITVTLSETALIDTTNPYVAPVTNAGITLVGGTVSGVTVSGAEMVIATAGAASSVSEVRAALTGQTSPRTEAGIPRTNIRSVRPIGVYSFGGQIQKWLCHQEITIS